MFTNDQLYIFAMVILGLSLFWGLVQRYVLGNYKVFDAKVLHVETLPKSKDNTEERDGFDMIIEFEFEIDGKVYRESKSHSDTEIPKKGQQMSVGVDLKKMTIEDINFSTSISYLFQVALMLLATVAWLTSRMIK